MANAEEQRTHETTEAKLEWLAQLREDALHAGSERAVERHRSEGKLLARERAERLCDPGSFVELDRYVRHRESNFGMLERRLRRRRRHRPRHDLRPQGLRLLAGLHRLRRLAERGLRREDLQGDGSRREARVPGDRDQRLRRRADPGGRRLARRLRGDLLAQRPGSGVDPADLAGHRPVRRRRRLLAGDHRLRLHGRGLVVHVHHRARRREDGDRRGGDVRGAGRRRDARARSPASRTSSRPTRRHASTTRASCSRSCRRTTSTRRRSPSRPIRATARARSSTR